MCFLAPSHDSCGRFCQAEITKVNRAIPSGPPLLDSLEHIPEGLASIVDEFISQLDKSVKLQTCDIPHDTYVHLMCALLQPQRN